MVVKATVDFKNLGFNSLNDYLDHFKQTVLETVHGYDFFVDWKKAEAYAKEHIIEFNILNSLTSIASYEERKKMLKKILTKYPECIRTIPSLIAVRENNIEVANITNQIIYYNFDFGNETPTPKEIDEMVAFCEKTGIIDLFEHIRDVYAYALGVEVGLDSNARKNRSGEAFNSLIKMLISSEVQELAKKGYPFRLEKEIELENLKINYPKQKKADFVIYYNDDPLVICEVNIYHGPGSKPNEIVRSYTDMENHLKSISKKFLWITDGPGWKKMWPQFTEASKNIDYILNYELSLKNLRSLLLKFIQDI